MDADKTPLFYGDLLTAVMSNDTKRVEELLSKLSDDQLQDLVNACAMLAKLAREVWYER